jgi:uncharacterized RDD family membrane protein YckC
MQACSCGVAHNDNPNTCPSFQSHTMIQKALPDLSAGNFIPDGDLIESLREEKTNPAKAASPKSTLIEFPRTSRPVPEWRKQLSQRVREVQERKAREAAEELAAAREAGLVSCALPSGQLELVPDLEQSPMNPIVSKVLERLERARRSDYPLGSNDGALALDAPPDNGLAIAAIAEVDDDPKPLETKHKLTIVAPVQTESEPPSRKPVRVIADDVEDAALSYLENSLSIKAFDSEASDHDAGFFRRGVAGILDLVFIALLATPFAALIEFADANWADRRTMSFMAGATLFVMFAYLTMSTAVAGRTLGMRMLALRTIDMRTGLIPTGGQSIKRAIANIFSLGLLGFGLLYGLVDRDGRTIPDRFSKTLVIHD